MSSAFDPRQASLKVGLEIHQQLAARTKLFCACPVLKPEKLPYFFERRLRPSQSELGVVDDAAVFEFGKGKLIRYRWNPDSACLVDADEEPPHPPNAEALETSLLIALMLRSRTVDEIHVMRKIVIDGSNTGGFQRTALIGLGGELPFDGKTVGVQSITVEEDSCRVLGEDERAREFGLDRLGAPLVEIALDPIEGEPKDVETAALALGRMLRSTGRVARGLGTIRQDLNVSVAGGDVVEVKGVQKLNLLAKVVRYEALRQLGLIKISQLMKERGVDAITTRVQDVTEVMKGSDSPVVHRVLKGDDQSRVYCVVADHMQGLIGFEPFEGVRLGKELAEIARTQSLGGIIHSDEFRRQGISETEERLLRDATRSDEDAGLILIAGPQEQVVKRVAALVVQRVEVASKGVPKETRVATEEGETRYMRPRPGAARMYPETDIPDIIIPQERIQALRRILPIPWEKRVSDYAVRYALSGEQALRLYDSDKSEMFERLAVELRIEASVVVSILTEVPARLSREVGVDETRLTEGVLEDVLRAIAMGEIAKEGAVEVLRLIGKGQSKNVRDAMTKLGISGMSDSELEELVQSVINRHISVVKDRGERAFSILMGDAMSTARGRVDGSRVGRLIKEKMDEVLARQADPARK